MPRESYVIRWVDGQWRAVPKAQAAPLRTRVPGPYIMPDIQPYESIITHEIVGSRSRHREHLREHNCEEIGDQAPAWLRERQRQQREER